MKTILCLIPFLVGFLPAEEGYQIKGDLIEFSYVGTNATKEVYVSGNFNNWTKDSNAWRMTFSGEDQRWHLEKSVKDIRAYGSFLEFTFRVDGKLIDADNKAQNVIHCTGYGYRYVIK